MDDVRNKLQEEVQAMQKDLDLLARFSGTSSSQSFLLGMLFLVLFAVTLSQDLFLVKGVALVSYALVCLTWAASLRVALQSKKPTLFAVGLGCVTLLAVGFVLLWFELLTLVVSWIILAHVGLWLLLSLLGILFVVVTYLQAKRLFLAELLVTNILALIGLVALYLYGGILAYMFSILTLAASGWSVGLQAKHARKQKNWLEKRK